MVQKILLKTVPSLSQFRKLKRLNENYHYPRHYDGIVRYQTRFITNSCKSFGYYP
jgi:hypothetical protein